MTDILKPESEAALAEVIASAETPLCVTGGGTRGITSGLSGQQLSTSGLSGVTLYEPGALTLVARAGTSVSEIEALLAEKKQRLAFEPMDHRGLMGTTGEPTIGGIVAANVSGPRRVAVGACRDHLLGVRFVDGGGKVIKNGGRVMKNVTGYDLVKLMAGSFGTLGVLTEVSLKVLPEVEARAVLLINGLSVADAVAAMSRALGSPYEVSGAAHTPSGLDGHPVTMLRVEGFAESVAYRAKALQKLLAEFGESQIEDDPARTKAGWNWVRNVEAFHGSQGDVWRVSCKPSDAPRLAEEAGGEALLDWGGGLLWVQLPEGTDLRARLSSYDGHATLVRASAKTRDALSVFEPQNEILTRMAQGLRDRFDPKQIFNTGLMG